MQTDLKMDRSAEKAKVETVIRNSIQWVLTKDTTLLYSCFVHDSTLFWFSPDNRGTVSGFEAFRQTTEQVFLNPKFKGVGSECRNLRVDLSNSGDCAWWSCFLDDFNEWDGQPANWENVRWTGVLEKIDGEWRIRQMHFSYSEEHMRAAIQRAVEEARAGK